MKDLKAIRFIEGTKVSHDYEGNEVDTFGYRELWEKGIPHIGLPCKQNNLVVIDVDVAGLSHKKDGREWWQKFAIENSLPSTYTVRTPSGGFHFYYRLPQAVNPDMFFPPGELAPGVDVKWRGWVGAPPSAGYVPFYGTLLDIVECPPVLMAELARKGHEGNPKEFTYDPNKPTLDLHQPFTKKQIDDIRAKITWIQENASLSREEWRNGLFALKAGIDDENLLQELAMMWTHNKGFANGDDVEAQSILDKASKYGGIGPGTISAIFKNHAVKGSAPMVTTGFTREEIIARSRVIFHAQKDGSLRIENSEANIAAILGAMFTAEELYHDTRSDHYVFKGEAMSDVEIVNTIIPALQSTSHGLGLEKFKKSVIAGGLEVLLNVRRVDPHVQWLKSLQWDGIPRIDRFFSDYLGVDDSHYMRAVSKNFWIALAARGIQPGIKFDSMVILEGHEGIRKSTLVQTIGGEYTFAPSDRDLMNDTDQLRMMHQSIIVELPEMMGLINQDANKVKAFLAKPFDHIRSLWAKKAMKRLRGFLFVGTTNNSRYLSADMGVRRFWPVRIPAHVKDLNLEGIKIVREQLFAEGAYRFGLGEYFHNVPHEELSTAVKSRALDEPLTHPIREILGSIGPTFRVSEIYQRLEMGGYCPKGFNALISKRIEVVLAKSNCEEIEGDNGIIWRQIDFKYPEAPHIVNVPESFRSYI